MTSIWTATGLAHDLPKSVVMAGCFQDTELAIWRSATGKLSAWVDRCPHRGMRLSHGFVRGETLSCIYHGWVYGTDGGCKHIPAHPALTPSSAIKAQAYLCVESDGVLWLAPAEADQSTVPSLPNLQPIRSLSLTCDLEALRAADPALTGQNILRAQISLNGSLHDICLLVQENPEGLTLHALAGPQADPIAVSRWLEALRRRAEARGNL